MNNPKKRISEMTYVVSVSGGLSSAEALRRTLEQKGRENTVAVFADVGSVFEDGQRVSGEEDDLYRFLDDVERALDFPIYRLRNEKYSDVWDCFIKNRFIGNTRLDVCSKFLKRAPLKEWVSKNFPVHTMVIGFSWFEPHRAQDYREYVSNSWFPLMSAPYVDNDQIAATFRAMGVEPSKSYADGFLHDNCGGFCVKMGLGQAYHLWSTRRHRWMYNERKETEFQAFIGKPVTVFRKGQLPISMKILREQFEAGYVPRTANEKKGCAGRCMIPS